MLHLDALFVFLYFIKVENFAWIVKGLKRPAPSLRIFCVIYIDLYIKKFIFLRSTLIEFWFAEKNVFLE